MIIPKTLKIGGHTFEIDSSLPLLDMNGKTEFKEGKIYICSDIPQTQKESTLIHEVLHVINSTMSDSDTGHMLQDSISEQLYQVLKDNDLLK